MIEYRILGPLEAVGDDGLIALGGQKQRALLALLLIHAGKVVSTEHLVGQLWGEHPPRTATTSLQNFVSQLRKLLGGDALVTKPPGYVLRVDADHFDFARFEQLVADARQTDPETSAKLLRDALDLWRGPALSDLAFEDFAQGEIRRLEELRLDALEGRLDADLATGAGGELVGELEQLVTDFPLRERLRGQLMLALYRAGRQAEALQVYHEARRVLVDELGIEPSPALQQLYTSMLRQEAELDVGSTEVFGDDHLTDVINALLAGRLVPVLGPGVDPEGSGLDADALRAHLAERFDCSPQHARGLAHVAEHAALLHGIGPLYDELHELLAEDHEPGRTHRFVVTLIRFLRDQGQPCPLVVTTNFDTALERALSAGGEDFDVVSYVARGSHVGKFVHTRSDGSTSVIDLPNSYDGLALNERSVLLKVHGQVDRTPERDWESFVVAEDDHIDYLSRADLASFVPVTLAAKLRRSHFLFLGYLLDDWSLRVFLHRVWGRDKVSYRSWAVVAGADRIEREHWSKRGIDVVDVPLDSYLDAFESRLAEVAG